MKMFLLSLLLLPSLATSADLVIVQKVEGPGQSGEMTLKFKDNLMRMDVSPQVSTLTNVDTGEMTTIMNDQKSYMIVSAASAKAMMNQMSPQNAGTASTSPPPSPKLAATGRTEKINGYDTQEYLCDIGGMKINYWLAPKYPNWPVVLDAMMKFQRGGLASLSKGLMPGAADFVGMPLRTEMNMSGQKIRTTLVSVKNDPVDPAEFKIPAGYREIKMPDMNAPQP